MPNKISDYKFRSRISSDAQKTTIMDLSTIDVFSESQMRDELERRGVLTHNVHSGDRDTLKKMLVDNFISADLGGALRLDSGGVSRTDLVGAPNSSGNITSPSAPTSDSVDYVEMEKQLRVQVEAKRRYYELVEEMAQLNNRAIHPAQLMDPNQILNPIRPPAVQPHPMPANQQQIQPPAVHQAVHPPPMHVNVHPQNQQLLRLRGEDLDNVVETFTGDDNYSVASFIRDFEAGSRQFGIPEDDMGIIAKRFIRGTAKTLLRAVRANTWDDIRGLLRNEFTQIVSATSLHKRLAQRRKLPNETVLQYSVAMREIAASGQLDEVDVIGYIVDGLARDKNERLFLSGANNYGDLRGLLNRFQEMLNASPKVSLSNPTPYVGSNGGNSSGRVMNDTTARKQTPKCFNCNEVGHYAALCGKSKRPPHSCFKCGSMDHQIAQCKMGQLNIKQEIANVENNTDEYDFVEQVSLILCNNGSKQVIKLNARLDTASPISFVQEKIVPIQFLKSMSRVSERHVGLNNSPIYEIGVLNVSILFRNRITNNITMSVVRNGTMRSDVIIGRDFMRREGLRLVSKFELKLLMSPKPPELIEENAIREILSIETEPVTNSFEINEKLEKSHINFISELVKSCSGDHIELSNSDIELNIRLSKNETFHCAPRRLSVAAKDEVKTILDRMLDQGVIQPSSSAYSSPIVLIKKKCGATRLCVDYRALNKITLRDNYPLPLIEDQIDSLHNKNFFSCLDLKDGFHHVRVAKDSVKFTAFVTPLGQFEFLRMPFGLRNAPSVFQRFINNIFRPLIDANKILIYMDDILVATSTIEEHLKILAEVFKVIRENSLQLKLSKCKFLFEEIDYLGYRVNREGIQPNRQNLETIKGFPIPKNARDVHSFLGLASYFRKFIRNFATIAKPLYDLIRKDAVFSFTEIELNVFNKLKDLLLSEPVLAIYSSSDPTELHCDASSLGYGAILLQQKSDKNWHPVFYFSKRTTDAESRFHSFELETLAIVNALNRFRIYLEGITFTIVTDCNSLALTLKKKHINPRIARWALELENYHYEIVHRGNERMRHVDALSRNMEIAVVESNSFEQVLAVEQGRDSHISELRSQLEIQEHSSFELSEGLVYRKSEDDKLLFYVPECLEDNVIRSCHDQMGHFGVDKVQNLIKKVYWFPKMKEKIKSFIQKCLICIQFSPNSGKVEGDLHNIPKGKLPFETIHIDHLGPLETSKQKHKHILVVVDGFTKFIRLFPVRTTNSKEAIACLTSYFQLFSRPIRIISDRGTCFTSKEFSEFVEKNNIKHVKVATASPQSNGQVERMNRIITPLLAKLADNSDWNKKLVQVEFCMNNSICRSTGTSPSILLFGVDQRGECCDKVKEFLTSRATEFRDLEDIRKAASAKIEAEQCKNKIYFDSRHKQPHQYKKDDLVMVSNYDTTPGFNKKLLPKYRGPYRIDEVFPNDRYRVVDVENWQVTQRPYSGIHAPAQIRPWVPHRE